MTSRLNHVVLIDDNETTNFLNRRLLDKLRVAQQVSVFVNAAEAFATLWSEASPASVPELVFVDLHMPQMDGVEFLALFQNLPAEVRALTRMAVLTTSLLPADRDRVAALGGSIEYLVKPLSREKLEKLLSRFFPHVQVAPVA